jgi:TPR repeat protein
LNTLDDIDFICSFNEEIGLKYKQAKSYYSIAPGQTLILIRSLLVEFCRDLLREYGEEHPKAELYDLVEKLKSTGEFNSEIVNSLHQIRLNGNRAAHPEQFPKSELNLKELAKEALLLLCKAIEMILTSIQGRTSLSYEFNHSADSESDLKENAYKALFKNDPDSNYEVAMALIQMRKQRLHETLFGPDADPFARFYDGEEMRHALHLLESPDNRNHADSQFQLGIAYLGDLGCEPNEDKALCHFSSAAYGGNLNGKAYYGYQLLNLKDRNKEDEKEAIQFLEEASEQGHPLALDILSVEYTKGEIVEKDIHRATKLLTEAANLGYPESQYKVAKLYLHQDNLEKYWHFISKAIDNGHVEALLSAGRTLSNTSKNREQLEKAFSYYHRYIGLTHDAVSFSGNPVARYELGSLVLKHAGNDPNEMREGLNNFVFSYWDPNCPSDVKTKIENLCPGYLEAIDNLLRTNQLSIEEESRWSKFYACFMANGHPFETSQSMVDELNRIAIAWPKITQPKSYMPQRNNVLPTPVTALPKEKVGRNDICPYCHSGKKYKKCHGK